MAGRKTIGLTFGVFDMLHIGHLNLLQNARDRCDELVVCVSTDEHSRAVKGKVPVIQFGDRIRLVAALRCVDVVDRQDQQFSKRDAVGKYRPDVLFVGDDWTPDTYSGEGLGVPVTYLPYTRSVSSTDLRLKLGL